jgi:hypothetical protein
MRQRMAKGFWKTWLYIAISWACDGSASAQDIQTLETRRVDQNDTMVRIHYEGGDATFSSWLTMSRLGQTSDVKYTIDSAIVRIPRPNKVSPVVSWDSIWSQLALRRFYDLQGDGHDPGCPAKTTVALDANVVTVELRRDNSYRKFSYAYPLYASCDGTRRMNETMLFLNRAFGGVLPIPK